MQYVSPERRAFEQASAEKFIQKFGQDISIAELFLRDAYVNRPKEEYTQLMNEVVADLDQRWPYYHHQFLVAGQWVRGHQEEVDRDQASVTMKFYEEKEDVLQQAVSEGFFVEIIDGEPRVVFAFVTNSSEISVRKSRMNGFMLASALPTEVSLTYLGVQPDSLHRADGPVDILERAEVNDGLHKLYLSKSNFYDLSHNRQKRLMEGLVENLNDAILQETMPIQLELSAKAAYVTSESRRPEFRMINPRNRRLHRITGRLASVGLFNQPAYDRGPVRSESELVDPAIGLYYDIVELGGKTPKAFVDRGIAHVAVRDVRVVNVDLEAE